jgi:hypothetical protein
LLEILPVAQRARFVKEDGKVVVDLPGQRLR